jgi:hypothetical protein
MRKVSFIVVGIFIILILALFWAGSFFSAAENKSEYLISGSLDTTTYTQTSAHNSSKYTDDKTVMGVGNKTRTKDSKIGTIGKPTQLPVIYALRTAENNPYAITCPGKKNDIDTCRTIRFEVRPGDYAFNGSRSQIRLKNRHTRHVEFDLRLNKFQYQNNWFSLMDWHTTAAYQKEYSNLPKQSLLSPLALQIKNNNLYFYNRANQAINKKDRNSIKLPFAKGWNHIDVRIKIADDESGGLSIKVNNTEKKFNNVATTYHIDFPTFLKFGIYRSATYSDTSVVEFRNVIVDDSLIVPDFSHRAAGEHVVDHLNGLQQEEKN